MILYARAAPNTHMQVPETPPSVEQLDLMRRLDAYANGTAAWLQGRNEVGPSLKQSCRTLHSHIVQLVNQVLAPLSDRIGAREMETFTMHDRRHGLKVAHLMWHILEPARRERLTPPEIALLVLSAHIHDLGMALSREERQARLAPDSDLWDRLEVDESLKRSINALRQEIQAPDTSQARRIRAEYALWQAEEALLSQDTRDRHATPERYQELLEMLERYHQEDPTGIPDVRAALSFEGDSLRTKLIDVCVSHCEDAEALVKADPSDLSLPRFPNDYPMGSCKADLHIVAAALRLADILDFDRERTPPVLFHYLLPTRLGPDNDRSVLEWGKHLAISNWHIEANAIVFRGRCNNHIIHHAIVHFCEAISAELSATHATFGPLKDQVEWPFHLPTSARADIRAEGYKYVPYRFELDDERVYELLMGGAIYHNPLVAVRELIQNAVDACKLRDALTQLYEPHFSPSVHGKILVRYEEPASEHDHAKLVVTDTGTGMDASIIQNWFLRVGRSYYNSSDFNRIRMLLRRAGLDFAPVSDFGIGFLSCFLLADRITVETAMWENVHGETRKRTLQIDGPTRLIRLDELPNEGPGRFKGTRVTLHLYRAYRDSSPSWQAVKAYLTDVCQDLPYPLDLEHVSTAGQLTRSSIVPMPLRLDFPERLEPHVLRISVRNSQFGLRR